MSLAIAAGKAEHTRPTLICCKTIIGKGAPTKAGTADTHGAALGEREVAATEGDDAAVPERPRIVGVDRERLLEERRRLPVDLALVVEHQRLGEAGDRVRVLSTRARISLAERIARQRVVADHGRRAAQQLPSLDVIRLARQAAAQLFHHLGESRRGHRVGGRVPGAVPGPVAGPEVAGERKQRHRGRDDRRGRAVAPRQRVRARRGRPDQRPGEQRDGCRREQRTDDDEQCHERSGSSSREAGSAVAARARRRITTAAAPRPPASSSAGAAHSSQVRGATGGLYSTKSP